MDNNSENSSMNYSEVMEPELILAADKSKGINQPGLTQGVSYVDCNGNTRHKYETLEVLSNRSTTKVEADEKIKTSEQKEPETSQIDTSKESNDTSTTTEEISKSPDNVEKPVDKVESDSKVETDTTETKSEEPVKVESKPKPAPKTTTKSATKPATKATTKTTTTKTATKAKTAAKK